MQSVQGELNTLTEHLLALAEPAPVTQDKLPSASTTDNSELAQHIKGLHIEWVYLCECASLPIL